MNETPKTLQPENILHRNHNEIFHHKTFIVMIIIFVMTFVTNSIADEMVWPAKTNYRYQEVNGNRIFYREAGAKISDKPTIVLLHGWPTSSHYFRELIPLLSGKFHIIAPDNLGSGYSDRPDTSKVTYTFELLADHIDGLLKALEINEYVFYMHDFGAPVGFRVMLRNPKKLKGIIAQNGITHRAGLGQGAETFFKKSFNDKSAEYIKEMDSWGSGSVTGSYVSNVKGKEEIMSPDAWTHDNVAMNTEEGRRVQRQLFQDYYNNLKSYPKWQAFLRKYQPPTLVVWGSRDKFFITAGGEAYKKDIPAAEFYALDAGHYALEEKTVEIARYIIGFMENL